MATRGLYGYIKDGKRIAEYNSHDSYPDSLGMDFYTACKENDTFEYPVGDNDISFLMDSLFCEWAYFFDRDDRIFEIWRGFQTEPDPQNPYGQSKNGDYYPCKRILCMRIDDIPSDFFYDDEIETKCKLLQRDSKLGIILP